MAFDVVIKGGRVVDGSGNPFFMADVGVKDGKILKIGRLASTQPSEIIDANGLVVSPGFIDMHSHSDFTLLVDGRAESKVRQGVTTEVIGNCGYSFVPIRDATKDLIKTSILGYQPGLLEVDWRTLGEYLDRIERQGVSDNVAPLIGHGAIRTAVMGFDRRLPTAEELEDMKSLIAQSMEDGAFGMSSGLSYPPGEYSDTEELIELCKVVAKHGGIYATHPRYEISGDLGRLSEAIEIGEKAGLPVQHSHFPALAGEWGTTGEAIKMIEEARARGLDITVDQTGYYTGGTFLSSLLPIWVHEGGSEQLLERLREPETREVIKKEMKETLCPSYQHWIAMGAWDKMWLTHAINNPGLEGKTFYEIGEMRRQDPIDAMLDILLEEGKNVHGVLFSGIQHSEEDVKELLRHEVCMIGSDGMALSTSGPLNKLKWHPRCFGCYPRIIGKFVREEKVITLEEAITKMTYLPAQTLGLVDRGIIREGVWADVTIFNLKTIKDEASAKNPNVYPQGIEYVLVNGQIVVEKGEHTGALPGKALRARRTKREHIKSNKNNMKKEKNR